MLCRAFVIVVLLWNGVLATRDLTELLGTLAREIVLTYFMDLPSNNLCLGVITEENCDILDYLQPLGIPTYHVNVTHYELMFSNRLGKFTFLVFIIAK